MEFYHVDVVREAVEARTNLNTTDIDSRFGNRILRNGREEWIAIG